MSRPTIASAARFLAYEPESHLIEEVFHGRLSGPAEAVPPDGGRTGVYATGWSLTRSQSRRTISSHARSGSSPKRWTSRSSRKVAATRCSPRPATGTKSTSSTNRVPVPTGSSAHPKAAASTCVASITRSNWTAFPDQTAAFPHRSHDRTTPRDGLCRHPDGPGRTLRDTRAGREPGRCPDPVRRPVRRRSSARRVPGGLRVPGSTYS